MTSDKFIKYSSIENHYQEGFLARCPQEPIAWAITEKIHGANFQVYFDGENFLVGSRNRFINSDENFYGLNKLVAAYKDTIMKMFKTINAFPITLYGEVYGDGVQKGVKYSKEKRIRFFDLKIQDEYVAYNLFTMYCDVWDLPSVPLITTLFGTVHTVADIAKTRFNSKIAEGEYANLENNICEGVVIRPYLQEYKTSMGSRVILKKKNEEFFEKSKMPESKPDRFADFKKDLESVNCYINQNRFDAVFSKDIYKKKNFGEFIKAYTQDVLEEAKKDSVEFSNIKNINNIVAKNTKQEYFARVA